MTMKCLRRRTGKIAARAHGADRGEVGVTAEPVRAAAGKHRSGSTAAGDAELAGRTRRKAGIKWAEVDHNKFANG